MMEPWGDSPVPVETLGDAGGAEDGEAACFCRLSFALWRRAMSWDRDSDFWYSRTFAATENAIATDSVIVRARGMWKMTPLYFSAGNFYFFALSCRARDILTLAPQSRRIGGLIWSSAPM